VHYYAMQLIDGRSLAAMIAELRRLDGLDPADGLVTDLDAISTSDLAARLLSGGSPDRSDGAGSDAPTVALPSGVSPPEAPTPRTSRTGPGRPATSGSSTRNRDYVRNAARLALEAAEALDHAHARGILHRDIKPANLLLDAQGRLWVTDFGLAQVRGDDRLTLSGDVLGTLRYMSPEQALGQRVVIDGRTDVYSLGVTLYELLTLQPAIDGRDRAEILRRIAEEEPTPTRRLNPGVPVDLETIVLKATDKDPTGRYATAGDLAEDLRRFLDDRPVRARRPSLLDRAAKWSRRYRAVVMTAALLLVLGTAVSTWQAVRAVNAEAEALDSAKRARTEASIARAVNDFLREDLLAEASPEKNPRANQVTVEALLNKAAARIEGKFTGQPAVEAAIRRTISSAYQALGLYPESQRHLERALQLSRLANGARHPDTLETMKDLASGFLQRGRYQEAEPLLSQALDIQRRALGPEHPDTLRAMHNLGELYLEWRRYEAAERLLTQALEIQRRALGPEHPDTLESMFDLGGLYRVRGLYQEAEPLLTQVLEIRRRVSGPEHLKTLEAMKHLATLYATWGRYEAAERLYMQLLEIRRRVQGPEHPDTLREMHNLVVLYGMWGQHEKAEPLLTQGLDLRRYVQGPEHPDTLEMMRDLAEHYLARGQPEKAEPLLTQVLDVGRRVLGPEHPHRLDTMLTLAVSYRDRHQPEKAEPLLNQVLDLRRRTLGPEHPHTLDAMDFLSRFYLDQRRQPRKAEPLLEEALEGASRLHGEEHPLTVRFMFYLGSTYREQGKLAKARPLLEKALEGASRLHGEEHPNTLAALSQMALLYGDQGRLAESESVLVRVAEIARRRWKVKRWQDGTLTLPWTLNRLARNLLVQGKFAEAEPVARESTLIYRESMPGSWQRFCSESLVGGSLLGQKKYAEAEPLLLSSYEGMKAREARLPVEIKHLLTEAGERIVRLYEAWGRPAEAAAWRNRLGLADLPDDVFARP
jgi:tetratricopeptide (TPR) repeat protein